MSGLLTTISDIPWTWTLIRASGIAAYVMLTLVVVEGLAMRCKLIPGKSPALLAWHRTAGLLAVAMLAAHLGLLLIDPVMAFTPLQILIPGAAPWKPLEVALGTIAAWLLILPIAAHAARKRLKRYAGKAFRKAHTAAYAAWPLATLHFAFAGTDRGAGSYLIAAGSAAISYLLIVRGWDPRAARPRRAGGNARTSAAP